jgi:hypothetical protein
LRSKDAFLGLRSKDAFYKVHSYAGWALQKKANLTMDDTDLQT